MDIKLKALLAPPSEADSQESVRQLVSTLLPRGVPPSQIGATLANLLGTEEVKAAVLANRLAASGNTLAQLLTTTKEQLAAIHLKTTTLKSSHEALEDALIDHREALVSSLSQRERDSDTQVEGTTLKERLQALSSRRLQLKKAREYFAILAKTEEMGMVVLRALDSSLLPDAFSGYVALVNYVKGLHNDSPTLALSAHLVALASSVWNALVKTLSSRLVERLEKIGWPTAFAEPLDYADQPTSEFKTAFLDLLNLEKLHSEHPLPGNAHEPTKADVLLVFVPLCHSLLQRFKWHFDGTRTTNRIDKPEYPLSHVLNLLTTHERFLSEDVQDMLSRNGFAHVNSVNDFTTLLLAPLAARLVHHIPQLLELPPVLAHTIYQTLEFDGVLASRHYRPRGHVGEWRGLSEVILGETDWYNQWLKGETEFFEARYYSAISAATAWQIIGEEDYDVSTSRTSTRPTISALQVAELVEQLADRYRPLPTAYTLPFLFSLHLPLLTSYAQRITSSLDAFESLSFGLGIPGALADSRSATKGIGGMVRLVRAGVSARWMSEKCAEWGEDSFFLSLFQYVTSTAIPSRLRSVAETVFSASEGTLFDAARKEFETLADRSEDLIVRHVVSEVLSELKTYLGRRWDQSPSEEGLEEDDFSLTPDLIAPLSLLSSLLASIVQSFPSSLSTKLYRRIGRSLSSALYERLLVNRSWSETGARQFEFDVEHGFLQAGREAGVQRGVNRGWEILLAGSTLLALRATPPAGLSFAKVMRAAWDDDDGKVVEILEELGIPEALNKGQVQTVLRRRPECWR